MKADGRLTGDLFPGEKPQDECGVFGVFAPGQPIAQLAYYGLYALQHRGQESAGIAVSNGSAILVYKDMGLVSQVFDDKSLSILDGHLGVGHVRYATTGRSAWENAQPTLGPTRFPAPGDGRPASGAVGGRDGVGTVAIAHNGNLTNTTELMAEILASSGNDLRGELGRGSSTDTAVMTALLGAVDAPSLQAAALSFLPRLKGAFSLAFMDETTLYAARDRHGFRPLVLGRLEGGWAVAS